MSSDSLNNEDFKLPKLSASERVKRALPNLREQHVCICSKTLWLGHLTKSISEEYVIEKLNELLPNSSRIISEVNLIPPRGCAYVEFADRALAAQCLNKMKQGYRMDGNSIKVAWATNKGINDDKKMKKYWNVEVGCTYIPWIELMTSNSGSNTLEPIDLVKLTEGGLIDEDSIPSHFYPIYKQKLAASIKSSEASKADDNDMDLESDDEHGKPVENGNVNSNFTNSTIPPPNPYQSIMLPSQIISSLQFLNQNNNGLNGKSAVTNNGHHLIQSAHPPPPPPPGQIATGMAQLPFTTAFSQSGLSGIMQAHGAPPPLPPPRPPSNSLSQAPTSTTPTSALPPQFFNHHHLFQTIPPPPLQNNTQANGNLTSGMQIPNESKQNENLAFLQGKPNNIMQILNSSQLVSIQPSAEFLDIHQLNLQKQQQQQQQQQAHFHPHLAPFNQMPGTPSSNQPLQLNLRPIFLTKSPGNQLPILNAGFLNHLNLLPQGSQLSAPFNGTFVPSAEHMQAIAGLNQLDQLSTQFQKEEELNRMSNESTAQLSGQENKQALRSLMDMNFDRVANTGANGNNNEEVRENSDSSLNKTGELEESFSRSSVKSYQNRRPVGDTSNNRSTSNGSSFTKGFYSNNTNTNNSNTSSSSNYRNFSQNSSSNKNWNRNHSSNNNRYDSSNNSKNHRHKNYDSTSSPRNLPNSNTAGNNNAKP